MTPVTLALRAAQSVRPHGNSSKVWRANEQRTRPPAAHYAWIDAHFDDKLAFLQALVRAPTDTRSVLTGACAQRPESVAGPSPSSMSIALSNSFRFTGLAR